MPKQKIVLSACMGIIMDVCMSVQVPSHQGMSNLLTCLSFGKIKEGAKSQCNAERKQNAVIVKHGCYISRLL